MANRPPRPLPTPPGPVYPFGLSSNLNHFYSLSNRYQSPDPDPPSGLPGPSLPLHDDPPTATLRGGTLLHKGFYDLLALIPTPSPSRFLWGISADPVPDVVAGPRYEDLPATGTNDVPGGKPTLPAVSLPPSGPVSPKKGKRISKDMVSNPMGFVYVCDRSTGTPVS
jgi:protein-serine/threonine kinase